MKPKSSAFFLFYFEKGRIKDFINVRRNAYQKTGNHCLEVPVLLFFTALKSSSVIEARSSYMAEDPPAEVMEAVPEALLAWCSIGKE